MNTLHDLVSLIESEVSTDRLLTTIDGFTQFHRIQASPGHRKAINFISDTLTRHGVESRVLRYPSDYGVSYLGNPVFKEWNCNDAELLLVYPENILLADFKAMPTSILQKSGPCNHMDFPIDIVYLNKGNKEEDYPGLDIKGKLIFIRGEYKPFFEWAVNKAGALGIIGDYSEDDRGEKSWSDLQDIHKYRGIFYFEEQEKTPFGFVITPNQAEKLAALCEQTVLAHEADPSKQKYPQAKCFVDSSFYAGYIEDAEAHIKGETDEEVWILAHSCHPKHCANDNASGVAAASEAIVALNRLIAQGRLDPPKRTIKVLLMAEFTGTYPYLANEGNGRACRAALNLDMVGGRQDIGYGPLMVVGLPKSTPSFVADACACLLSELKKESALYSGGDKAIPLFNALRQPFMGGSDHLILSDPAVGIPTPALMQWPDTFYHTSGDTLDVISPHLLKKSSTLAAAYAYLMSSLSVDHVETIFRESLAQFLDDSNQTIAEHKAESGLSLKKKLGFVYEYYVASAESAALFFTDVQEQKAIATLIQKHKNFLASTYKALLENYTDDSEKDAKLDYSDNRIPHRLIPAISMRIELKAKSPEQKEALKTYNEKKKNLKNSTKAFYLAQYYTDGKHSIDSIVDHVLFDTDNTDRQAIYEQLYLLETLHIISFS